MVNVNPGKEIGYPSYRELGGPRGRSGRILKLSPLLGFDPRTVQRTASRCTGPHAINRTNKYYLHRPLAKFSCCLNARTVLVI